VSLAPPATGHLPSPGGRQSACSTEPAASRQITGYTVTRQHHHYLGKKSVSAELKKKFDAF